jgi:uncharacterized protein with von Willebrand factor type A (vWA) domain
MVEHGSREAGEGTSAPSGARSNAQAGAEANTPTDPETKELTEAAMKALADALLEVLVEFARQLRRLGLDVSLVELTDALRAVRDADFLDRARFRRLLMITLVKRAADIPTFIAAFELLFPAAGPPQADGRREGPRPGPASGPPGQAADADLLSRFVAALRGDKSAGLQDLATEAVTAFSGLGADGAPGAAGSGRYYQYRVLRQLDISSLLQRAMRLDGPPSAAFADRRLASIERQDRVERLRAEIAAEVRSRLADVGGLDSALSQLRDSIMDEDFLRAGPAELAAMRDAVRPLARRLAAAARRRRRMHSSGKLDVRRTVRRAVAAGGVPMEPAWRQRRRSRPRLVLLCDVSGSVAEFAKFTLSLLHALHAELPRLRSFVFTDGLAEVTDLVEASPGVIDTRLLLSRPGVVRGDGHSDYGAMLRHFIDEYSGEVHRDSVLIICGDARTNYRPAGQDLLHAVRGRVRTIHWLNPEPRENWDTTDSRIGDYARDCDTVTEVRNLRQLSDWADALI